jgi:hypothetical protein
MRYEVRQSDNAYSPHHPWYLWDNQTGKVVARSDNQYFLVKLAQERSNFRPENGDLKTYQRQCERQLLRELIRRCQT